MNPVELSALIIAAIAFLSPFTYQLSGFFLGQPYGKSRLWYKARKDFEIWFAFVDDLNTELVFNGIFAVLFITTGMTKWPIHYQLLAAALVVISKIIINYRFCEIIRDYFCGPRSVKQAARAIEKWWWWLGFGTCYAWLLVIILSPFFLVTADCDFFGTFWPPCHHWLKSKAVTGPVENVAILVISVHVLFWVVLAEIWRPGRALETAKESDIKNRWLKEDIKRSFGLAAKEYESEDKNRGEEEVVLQVAQEMIARLENNPLNLLYAGCGPGRILSKLATAGKVYWNEIIAVDLSEKVVAEAWNKVSRVAGSSDFVKVAVEDFSAVDFVTKECKERRKYTERFDIVACLNNTLGNVVTSEISEAHNDRIRCLRNFLDALKPGGKLVLTVYNANSFTCEPKYSEFLTLLPEESDFKNNDFVLKFEKNRDQENTLFFYAHWFKRTEIEGLLGKVGFHVDKTYFQDTPNRPQVRIVAIATKPTK